MPVTPTSYEAQVSAALVNMVAASATFQAAAGAANATAARAFIVEDDAGLTRNPKTADGTALNLATMWAAVRVKDTKSTLRAWNTYGTEGNAQILIVLPRASSAETDRDFHCRGRNLGGGLRADLNAQWGQVVNSLGTPAAADVDDSETMIADETGPCAGSLFIHLNIAWRDIP